MCLPVTQGIYELKNLDIAEMKSVKGEYFATTMQELHEQVKKQL